MITLYNPHVDDFLAEPPHFRLLKRRALKKYGFFISGELERIGEVRVLIDGTTSAFIPEKIFTHLPSFIRNLIASMEFALWRKINKFDHRVKKVAIPTKPVEDVLLAFSYKAATGSFLLRKKILSKYKVVVFHLSHYFILTNEKSKNISELNNVWLAGDSDISNNSYFKHFFPWYQRQFLVLSFAVDYRFRNNRKFNERQLRCVATGSFHNLKQEFPVRNYIDYLSVTGFSTYHPLRKKLFDNAEDLSSIIECKISPYRSLENGSKLKFFLRHFFVSQRKYFAIDIVDLYNNYQCAVIGEEYSGFPALGAFEAMACGCILIAETKAYSGLGLIEGVHYFQHDGSIESVMKAVRRAVGCAESGLISRMGCDFVDNNFRPEIVHSRWILKLHALQLNNATSESNKKAALYAH